MQGANFVADLLLEQRGFEPPVPGAEAITKRNRVLREDCPPNQLTNAAALF
jgi:hypothetical protein